MNGLGQVLEKISPVILLAIAAAFAILYSRKRAIVILPALMFASLIGRYVGLELDPTLMEMSTLAVALLVFVAGLELHVDFIRKEKERMMLTVFFEFLLILSFYYLLRAFASPSAAMVLTAVIVASNEFFLLEVAKQRGGRLVDYGIAVSVLENSLAVFLLSLGFFSSGAAPTGEQWANLLALTTVLVIGLFFVTRPFNHFLKSAKRKDTKVLLVLLYIIALISTSELLGLPEAIPVFLGAIFLALYGFDRELLGVMESYMYLAVFGFVMSLPYLVLEVVSLEIFVGSLLIGAVMAIVAFLVRGTFVFVSSVMSGLPIDDSLTLGVSLANTGEFGLLIVASLLAGGLVAGQLALAAMFAYSINLTLMSLLVRKIDKVEQRISAMVPKAVFRVMEVISREMNILMTSILKDAQFKRHVYGLVATVAVVYVSTGLIHVVVNPVMDYFFTVLIFSAFILSIYIAFGRFASDLERVKISGRSFAILAIRLAVLYIVVAPLLSSISELHLEELILGLGSPITLLAIFGSSLLLMKFADFVSDKLSKYPWGGEDESASNEASAASMPEKT